MDQFLLSTFRMCPSVDISLINRSYIQVKCRTTEPYSDLLINDQNRIILVDND